MVLVRSLARFSKVEIPRAVSVFGVEQQFRFVTHPGVMTVAKLLEMRQIVNMRATFTQENVEDMKAFDPELARKAQIAYDNKLPVNFRQLELIEEALPRLLDEKAQLTAARTETAKLPPGKYELPKSLDLSAVRPVPNQKDNLGTMAEMAWVKFPEEARQVFPDPEDLKKIGK
mmetsp:Transcript_67547/g.162164  ORF Transcript_67547/g.162164 Transcript_67547/m.162164 type:complete len:173 (+) Transcript_67547:135-653(+)|eukprot:CAMPEP_0178451776 /NCGR_PEP_ID=MMETSP0689_2-20121128/43875_1 /TAXON_ID=160604 /ORGANISM="Amphidinium massartii, Strain CS-259" /LENGTH=172 /DNA_ID=CAMNT_0020077405 /DNA_START=122 /DNA_END=640 /DNA_ORIENTATION=+